MDNGPIRSLIYAQTPSLYRNRMKINQHYASTKCWGTALALCIHDVASYKPSAPLLNYSLFLLSGHMPKHYAQKDHKFLLAQTFQPTYRRSLDNIKCDSITASFNKHLINGKAEKRGRTVYRFSPNVQSHFQSPRTNDTDLFFCTVLTTVQHVLTRIFPIVQCIKINANNTKLRFAVRIGAPKPSFV